MLLGFAVEGGLTAGAELANREDVVGIGRVGAEKSILNEALSGQAGGSKNLRDRS